MNAHYYDTPYHRRTLRKTAAPVDADSAVRIVEQTKRKGKAGKAANKTYSNLIALAENPNLNKKYLGLTKDEVQKLIEKKNLSGAELARIEARQLTAGQNLKALGSQLKNQKYTPGAVLKRGWEVQGEGGGGYMGGTRMGRYIGLGGKSMTGMFAVGDAKDAVNKVDPTGQGRSRTERVGYGAGGAIGGVLGGVGASKMSRVPGGGVGRFAATLGLGIGGLLGGYYAGGKAGKYLDKGISKARGVDSGDYMQNLKRRAGFKKGKDGLY